MQPLPSASKMSVNCTQCSMVMAHGLAASSSSITGKSSSGVSTPLPSESTSRNFSTHTLANSSLDSCSTTSAGSLVRFFSIADLSARISSISMVISFTSFSITSSSSTMACMSSLITDAEASADASKSGSSGPGPSGSSGSPASISILKLAFFIMIDGRVAVPPSMDVPSIPNALECSRYEMKTENLQKRMNSSISIVPFRSSSSFLQNFSQCSRVMAHGIALKSSSTRGKSSSGVSFPLPSVSVSLNFATHERSKSLLASCVCAAAGSLCRLDSICVRSSWNSAMRSMISSDSCAMKTSSASAISSVVGFSRYDMRANIWQNW